MARIGALETYPGYRVRGAPALVDPDGAFGGVREVYGPPRRFVADHLPNYPEDLGLDRGKGLLETTPSRPAPAVREAPRSQSLAILSPSGAPRPASPQEGSLASVAYSSYPPYVQAGILRGVASVVRLQCPSLEGATVWAPGGDSVSTRRPSPVGGGTYVPYSC